MRVRCGTSGYSYKEWKGGFYPHDLPAAQMLRYYAERLPTVEINNTFYRMPRAAMVAGWVAQVPDDFRFVVKANRRITHLARLKNCEDSLRYLFEALGGFGEQLGLVLFQLPPNVKKDVALLAEFLSALPVWCRPAFEFRNASWFDDQVYETLRARGAALVGGDLDEEIKNPPLIKTAPFGYLRLRRSDYDERQIADWAQRISEMGWDELYGFFKHEMLGPEFAGRLNALLSAGAPPALD